MARIDQQLAMYEFFGGQTTILTSYAASGSPTIQVQDKFNTQMFIIVSPGDMESGASSVSETVFAKSVSGTGPYTLTLGKPLQNNYGVGTTVAPFSSSPSSLFPWLQTVVNGEFTSAKGPQQPVLYLLSPKTKEERRMAQVKFITYSLTAVLVDILPQVPQGDGGPYAINTFYAWLDSIANQIRTNKQLITPSYPKGASIKFGENFTIEENHQRTENEVFLVGRIHIESVEQVNA